MKTGQTGLPPRPQSSLLSPVRSHHVEKPTNLTNEFETVEGTAAAQGGAGQGRAGAGP